MMNPRLTTRFIVKKITIYLSMRCSLIIIQ